MATRQVVCDTDVMIDYWDTTSKRHLQTRDILENQLGLNQVVISAITQMELVVGARNKAEETLIQKKLLRFNTALINNEITIEAMRMLGTYRLSHGLAIPDCMIAATAIVLQRPLFTYNLKDFRFIKKLDLFEFPNANG